MKKFGRFCLSILLPIACLFSVGLVSLRSVDVAESEGESKGGGLVVRDGSTFTLEGNKSVSGFSADYGGGIYVYSGGTLNIDGGDVFSNTATKLGGGIFVEYGAILNMTDGTISRNSATDGSGGGVYNNGTFNMSGGTIASNIASLNSTAVYSNGGFTMTGGSIIGNVSVGYSDKLLGGTIIGDVRQLGDSVTIGNQMNISGNIHNNGYTLYFLCQDAYALRTQGKLYASKTVHIDDYQDNDFSSLEIVLDDASKFTNVNNSILYFNKTIKNLDLSKFNITGYDKDSYTLKITQSGSATSVLLTPVSSTGYSDGLLFTNDWKSEICSSYNMTTYFGKGDGYFSPEYVTGISFGKTPKSGYSYAGTLSSGIAVYKNGTYVQFVADHIYAPEDSSNLFVTPDTLWYRNVISFDFIDMTELDTSKVTNMRGMFSRTKIGELDMTGCDVSNVTDTSFMFYNTKITGGTLNLSSLNFDFDNKIGSFKTSIHTDSDVCNEGVGSGFRMFKEATIHNLYLPTSMTKMTSSHMFHGCFIDNLYFSNLSYVEEYAFYFSTIGVFNGTFGDSDGKMTLGFESFSYLQGAETIILPPYITYLNTYGRKIADSTGTFTDIYGNLDETYADYNSSAFNGASFKSVEFLGHEWDESNENNKQYIPAGLFYVCENLETLKIGEGIVNLQKYAFLGANNIKNLYLPTTITEIRADIFSISDDVITDLFISDALAWGKVKISGLIGKTDQFKFSDIYLNGKPLKNLEISFEGTDVVTFPASSYNFGGCTSLQTITVGDNVSLRYNAFHDCTALREVTFTGTARVGEDVFKGCSSLSDVNFQSADTAQIGSSAFENCLSLVDLNFSSGVSIGSSAFSGCSSLMKLEFPSTVTFSGSSVFSGCVSLSEVNFLSEEKITVGASVFKDCKSLLTLSFASDVDVESGAFSGCSSLIKVVFPSTVSIGSSAFKNCTALLLVECPTVTSIGESAFEGCSSLQTINDGTISFSGSVGTKAFYGCSSLTKLNNTAYSTGIGQCAFSGCTSLGNFSWKAVSGSISSYAFSDCTSLESVNLNSEGLDYSSLSEKSLYIYSSLFSGCSSLRELILPCSTKYINSTGLSDETLANLYVEAPVSACARGAFQEAYSVKILYSGTSAFSSINNSGSNSIYLNLVKKIEIGEGFTKIESQAFYYCSSLEELILPSSVTSIGNWICDIYNNGEKKIKSVDMSKTQVTNIEDVLADCPNLVEVKLPSGLTSVGSKAFYSSQALKEISIPSTVYSIYPNAFENCSALEIVNIMLNENSQSELRTIYEYAFNECWNLREINGIENTNVSYVGNYAFNQCSCLKEFAFPLDHCIIGKKAFYNNKLLRIYDFTLTTTSGTTYIGDDAFYNCYSLGLDENGSASEKITIVNNMIPSETCSGSTTVYYGIGAYSFQNCISISELDITAMSIGPAAFSYCTSLDTLSIDVNSKNENGDLKATATVVYTEGDNSVSDPKDTFFGCASLKTVTFGSNLKVIPESMFYGCLMLKTLNGSTTAMTTIGAKAFFGCAQITTFEQTSVISVGKQAFKYCLSLYSIKVKTGKWKTGLTGTVSVTISSLGTSNDEYFTSTHVEHAWTWSSSSFTSESSPIITVPEQTTEITTQTLEKEVNQEVILPEAVNFFGKDEKDVEEE